MISLMLALAAAQAPLTEEAQFKNCTSLAKSKPQEALSFANEWRMKGGGVSARQCLGLAYAALERWAPAAVAFEQAAQEAETAKDARRADLWAQSGNSWLAGEDGAKARKAFDSALASEGLTSELRGEVHLDRARAAVLLGDIASARADIDKGLQLVARDPFAWYLSSALALKEGKMAKAQADIAKAVELAPKDADVLLQAGTIAGQTGDMDAARSFYTRAASAEPNSEAGRAASAALAEPQAPKG
ncbi:MAG TPA: hypothetical protein VNT25_06770 [Allosphingosinicella sp.]|nr:hypothetical protein [Allosphingosinicella sp.]